MLEIYITTLTGRKITINNITSSDSIKDLKQKIQDSEGIPLRQQNIIFERNELEDCRTLSDCNIQNNPSLHLIIQCPEPIITI